MKFAYADPPYVNCSHLYRDQDNYAGEVDHQALIQSLAVYDGWALSCSSPSLRYLLPLCPEDVRVMAWVKPFAVFKPNVNPAYAWEPVIVHGGRKRTREQATVRDWVSENITLRRGLTGAKPELFCYWLFEVLNIESGDTFEDLFPGTGAVTRALDNWLSQQRLVV